MVSPETIQTGLFKVIFVITNLSEKQGKKATLDLEVSFSQVENPIRR